MGVGSLTEDEGKGVWEWPGGVEQEVELTGSDESGETGNMRAQLFVDSTTERGQGQAHQ